MEASGRGVGLRGRAGPARYLFEHLHGIPRSLPYNRHERMQLLERQVAKRGADVTERVLHAAELIAHAEDLLRCVLRDAGLHAVLHHREETVELRPRVTQLVVALITIQLAVENAAGDREGRPGRERGRERLLGVSHRALEKQRAERRVHARLELREL